jgi:hypothetical protein
MMNFKFLEKTRTNHIQNPQREIIKIGAEFHEIKTKKLYKESMKQKVDCLKRLTSFTNP